MNTNQQEVKPTEKQLTLIKAIWEKHQAYYITPKLLREMGGNNFTLKAMVNKGYLQQDQGNYALSTEGVRLATQTEYFLGRRPAPGQFLLPRGADRGRSGPVCSWYDDQRPK